MTAAIRMGAVCSAPSGIAASNCQSSNLYDGTLIVSGRADDSADPHAWIRSSKPVGYSADLFDTPFGSDEVYRLEPKTPVDLVDKIHREFTSRPASSVLVRGFGAGQRTCT